MDYSLEQCMEECMENVEKYRHMRENNDNWNPSEMQNIRDTLSEALVFFSPYYADLRADSEQAEVDRKMMLEDRKIFWRDHYQGARGTAGLVESKAMTDCKDIHAAEVEAKRKYYKAKFIVERVDQTLNSIASRLKIIEKYDNG